MNKLEESRTITKKGLRYEIKELENCVKVAKKTGRGKHDIDYIEGLIKAYKGCLPHLEN